MPFLLCTTQDLARYEHFSKSVNSNQLIYHNMLGMLDSAEQKQQRYAATHKLYELAFPPAPPLALWPAPAVLASSGSRVKRELGALGSSPDASASRKRSAPAAAAAAAAAAASITLILQDLTGEQTYFSVKQTTTLHAFQHLCCSQRGTGHRFEVSIQWRQDCLPL